MKRKVRVIVLLFGIIALNWPGNILAQQKTQDILDGYDSGLQIVTVKLQDVNPPSPVQPAFNELRSSSTVCTIE